MRNGQHNDGGSERLMDKIWANRLIAGTKTWTEVPPSRQSSIMAELSVRIESGTITAEHYADITGEEYVR